MKILVAVKRVADPDNLNKIKLSAQGKVDTTGLEPKPSPYDEYALETALRLTENGTNTEGAPRRGRRRHVRPEGGRADAPRDARHRRRPRHPRRRDRRRARRRPRRPRPQGARREGEAGPRAARLPAGRERVERGRADARRVPRLAAGDVRRLTSRARTTRRSSWAARSRAATAQVRVTLPAVVTVLDKIVQPKSVAVQAHRRRRTRTPTASASRRSWPSWPPRRSRSPR